MWCTAVRRAPNTPAAPVWNPGRAARVQQGMRTYSRATALVPAAALAALGFLAGGCGNGAGEVADDPGPTESASQTPSSPTPSDSPKESAPSSPGKSEPSEPSEPPGDGSAAKTDLTIDIEVETAEQNSTSGTEPATWTLTCAPVGGDHPDPKAACAKLDKVGAKGFEPVPENKPCTQIMGGPEVAKVSGRLDGTEIDSKFTKAGGCEMNRYKKMGAVLAP